MTRLTPNPTRINLTLGLAKAVGKEVLRFLVFSTTEGIGLAGTLVVLFGLHGGHAAS